MGPSEPAIQGSNFKLINRHHLSHIPDFIAPESCQRFIRVSAFPTFLSWASFWVPKASTRKSPGKSGLNNFSLLPGESNRGHGLK